MRFLEDDLLKVTRWSQVEGGDLLALPKKGFSKIFELEDSTFFRGIIIMETNERP